MAQWVVLFVSSIRRKSDFVRFVYIYFFYFKIALPQYIYNIMQTDFTKPNINEKSQLIGSNLKIISTRFEIIYVITNLKLGI